MPLDPLTALGLAANIVQFVDFSCKLVSKSREIYETGFSAENAELEIIAKDLSALTAGLHVEPSSKDQAPQKELKELAGQCQAVADRLMETLELLKTKGTNTRWKSFMGALEANMKKRDIEALVAKINRLQKQLDTRVLIMIRKDMSDQHSQLISSLQGLKDEFQNLHMNRTGIQRLDELESNVLEAITRIQPANTPQSANIHDIRNSMRRQKPINEDDINQLSTRMQDLATAMSNLATESRNIAAEQTILRHLCFKTMGVRLANVADAHAKTFSWALSSQSPFYRWLRVENGVFFIKGKAGSGKSTLMKYLVEHRGTNDALKVWAGDQKLVTSAYFFWNAGTQLQKSQEGLLRNLLYDVLRQCPSLISVVCERWAGIHAVDNESDRDTFLWTKGELLRAFRALAQQDIMAVKFCFFIDGLDEYDGEHADLVEVLKLMASFSPNIKFCLSSRPWFVFTDAFDENQDRMLSLEELTEGDIRKYVDDMLLKNPRFQSLLHKDDRYQVLFDEMVRKAQGVFLWVILVVKSLLKGLTQGDRLSDLQKRLDALPGDLNAYFRHIFAQVEDIYQEQMAQTFQVAINASESLPLLVYSFLQDDDHHSTFDLPMLTDADIISRQEETRRRLDAYCKGLLEVPQALPTEEIKGRYQPFQYRVDSQALSIEETKGRCQPFEYRVDFLHKTVRDFLLAEEMQKTLSNRCSTSFSADLELCRVFTTLLKLVGRDIMDDDELHDLAEDLMYHAGKLEERSMTVPTDYLDEAERALVQQKWRWDGMHFQPFRGRPETAFVGVAVQMGLLSYVKAQLEKDPSLAKTTDRPLLDHYLRPSCRKHRATPNLNMLKLILSYGADPNQSYGDHSTVWSRYLRSIHESRFGTQDPDTTSFEGLPIILKELVSSGADLNKKATIGMLPRNKAARLAKIRPPPVADDVVQYRIASNIIREKLGEKVYQELRGCAKKRDEPIIKKLVALLRSK